MAFDTFEFRQLATFHLLYLEEEFGFRRDPDSDHDDALTVTVGWIGPVAVEAIWEPHNSYVGLAVKLLQDGATPTIGPIVSLWIEAIVKARSPEKSAWYYAFDLRRDGLDAYLRTAAADLRLHAEDILRGESLALVDEVRTVLRGLRGVPGVDWWMT